jgi:hypothetical protein
LDVSEIRSPDRAVDAWPAVKQKGEIARAKAKVSDAADMERTRVESACHCWQTLHTPSRVGKRNRRASPGAPAEWRKMVAECSARTSDPGPRAHGGIGWDASWRTRWDKNGEKNLRPQGLQQIGGREAEPRHAPVLDVSLAASDIASWDAALPALASAAWTEDSTSLMVPCTPRIPVLTCLLMPARAAISLPSQDAPQNPESRARSLPNLAPSPLLPITHTSLPHNPF